MHCFSLSQINKNYCRNYVQIFFNRFDGYDASKWETYFTKTVQLIEEQNIIENPFLLRESKLDENFLQKLIQETELKDLKMDQKRIIRLKTYINNLVDKGYNQFLHTKDQLQIYNTINSNTHHTMWSTSKELM
jgi:hypothetical protein